MSTTTATPAAQPDQAKRPRRDRYAAVKAAMAEPIPCECARCGGPATIYPDPAPRGTCVCLRCSRPGAEVSR